MSASPLTWHDIAGWQAVHGLRLTAFERECIAALDGEFLKEGPRRDPDERQK
jgi:hypothetical protein